MKSFQHILFLLVLLGVAILPEGASAFGPKKRESHASRHFGMNSKRQDKPGPPSSTVAAAAAYCPDDSCSFPTFVKTTTASSSSSSSSSTMEETEQQQAHSQHQQQQMAYQYDAAAAALAASSAALAAQYDQDWDDESVVGYGTGIVACVVSLALGVGLGYATL